MVRQSRKKLRAAIHEVIYNGVRMCWVMHVTHLLFIGVVGYHILCGWT